jgi:hypothetical protein
MKSILSSITVFVLLITSNFCVSQDIITKKTGEDIKSKILEVGISEIKFKNFDNQDGPTYSLLKQDILIIRYQNGTKDIFNQDSITSQFNTSGSDLFLQGQKDAKKYYKGYQAAGTATLLTSLVFSSVVGLIPAISSSSKEPAESSLDYPNADLMKKAEYYNGYTQKAKKIKQGKVWTNWGVALGINILAIIVVSQ